MSGGGPIERLVVVVPARNEARRIDAALGALDAARRRLPSTVTATLVVVADSCTDSTFARARLRLLTPPDDVLAVAVRSAGAARRAGARHALARSAAPAERTWLASTDADTVVGDEWLLRHLELAEGGAAAVAGVVELDPEEGSPSALGRRFRRGYRIEPDGTHPHVHAANLGVRADAYLAVGGWGRQPTGEEHDLWHRLRGAGYAPVADARLRVRTSARLVGRAPAGFAADLARLAGADRGAA